MNESTANRPWRYSALMLAAWLSCQAHAQFVPEEVEVCPSTAKVYDPEFHSGSRQMVYFDGRGSVRVAPVLDDGRIGSTDCKGSLVSRKATISVPDLPFRAGPEWAISARGLELYFTKLNRDGRPYLARAWFDGSWQQSALGGSLDRGLALTSDGALDPEPSLVYIRTQSPGTYELMWRLAGQPETEGVLPGNVDPKTGGAPRWVPGQHALSYSVADSQGIRQAVVYDVDTDTLTFLTHDAGNKDEVWLWPAPEFGGDMVMMTVVDGCCLRFYREVNGSWLVYREVRASDFSQRPAIFSPEPLVLDGRSYVVMQLAERRTGSGGIWMVELGSNGIPPTLLSDPSRQNVNRTEPEWFIGPDAVYVYISASQGSTRFALNRLKTPLQPAGR